MNNTNTQIIKTFEAAVDLIVGDNHMKIDTEWTMTWEGGHCIDIDILSGGSDLDERQFDDLTNACWQLGANINSWNVLSR